MNAENDTSPQTFPPEPPAPRRRLWPLVAAVALALAGWQWFDTHQHLSGLDAALAGRLADSEAAVREARSSEQVLRTQVEALAERLATLESGLGAQGEALSRDLERGREEAALLEVEQAITLAVQQLQLAGNVPVALLALQTADNRLARLDQSRLLPLRKALAKDIERLAAQPFVDMPGLNLRLEQAVVAVDRLPLASRGRPGQQHEARTTPENAPAVQEGWRATLAAIGQELRSLVRIERIDGETPVLLAPGQEFFLRENLKLRLLNARLALLSRDATTLKSELSACRDWVARYFLAADREVLAVQALLGQAMAADVGAELPDLGRTQDALRALRAAKDKP